MYIVEDFDGNVAVLYETESLDKAIEVAKQSCVRWSYEMGKEETLVKVYEGTVVAFANYPAEPTITLVGNPEPQPEA
jgi:hypothetical protein